MSALPGPAGMSDGVNEAAKDQESSVVTVQGTTTAVKEDSRIPITVVNSSQSQRSPLLSLKDIWLLKQLLYCISFIGYTSYVDIVMPPVIRKQGQPKGSEATIIGLPRKKKLASNKGRLQPFLKLHSFVKQKGMQNTYGY